MAANPAKTKIAAEFEIMKGFELAARDFYRKICREAELEDRSATDVLNNIGADEERHAGIVQEIVDIVNNVL